MNIYEYAMKIEKDGERYYKDLAETVEDKSLKAIFMMLADEEVKHYIAFDKMNKQQETFHHASTHLLRHTLTLLRKMRHENPHFTFSKSHISAFESALKTEKSSFDFYKEKGEMLEDGDQKEAFFAIAEEEHQHMILLENLIDFITDPDKWMDKHTHH